MSTTAQEFTATKGCVTAIAKSYSPGGRAGETNGLYVLRGLPPSIGFKRVMKTESPQLVENNMFVE